MNDCLEFVKDSLEAKNNNNRLFERVKNSHPNVDLRKNFLKPSTSETLWLSDRNRALAPIVLDGSHHWSFFIIHGPALSERTHDGRALDAVRVEQRQAFDDGIARSGLPQLEIKTIPCQENRVLCRVELWIEGSDDCTRSPVYKKCILKEPNGLGIFDEIVQTFLDCDSAGLKTFDLKVFNIFKKNKRQYDMIVFDYAKCLPYEPIQTFPLSTDLVEGISAMVAVRQSDLTILEERLKNEIDRRQMMLSTFGDWTDGDFDKNERRQQSRLMELLTE